MSNPFVFAIRQDPEKFLGELGVEELEHVGLGAVRVLEKKAKAGESNAAAALQSIYRELGEVEI